MNTLRQAVNEYIALRQAMGFKLHEESRLLPRFIDQEIFQRIEVKASCQGERRNYFRRGNKTVGSGIAVIPLGKIPVE